MGQAGDIASLIERGGVVMIPLLALSIISLTLILERSWFWLQCSRAPSKRRLTRLIDFLRAGDARAESLLASDSSIYAVIARAVSRDSSSHAGAIAAYESQRPRMERFMTTLSTIITAAPLLGILGTVLGIIQSFELLGQEQTLTDPRTVSAGIAQALLTTAAGLVVALITLFPYMFFRGQIERATGRIEAIVAAGAEGAARPSGETSVRSGRTTGGRESLPVPAAADPRGRDSE